MNQPLSFNGSVSDMGSRPFRGVQYTKVYVGANDPKAFQEYIENEARVSGVEILEVVSEVQKDGKLKSAVRFNSMKGVMDAPRTPAAGVVLFEKPKPSNGLIVFGSECEANFDWRM